MTSYILEEDEEGYILEIDSIKNMYYANKKEKGEKILIKKSISFKVVKDAIKDHKNNKGITKPLRVILKGLGEVFEAKIVSVIGMSCWIESGNKREVMDSRELTVLREMKFRKFTEKNKEIQKEINSHKKQIERLKKKIRYYGVDEINTYFGVK